MQIRTIQGVPEGGCQASDIGIYIVVDCPPVELGEGVTREWVILWSYKDSLWRTNIFIVHADTKEGAFDHFINLFPDRLVRAVKYYGIYF